MQQQHSKSNRPKSARLANIAVVALLVALVCGLLGAATAVANVVTHEENVGYTDVKLAETWGDLPDGNIYPGYTTERTAIVTNEGTEACYVRIRLDKFWADKETLVKDDPEKYDADLIEIGFDDTDNWEEDEEDGWWYYVDPLEPGAETTSLLKNVTFSTKIGEEFNNGESTTDFKDNLKDPNYTYDEKYKDEGRDSIYLEEAAVIDVELQAVTQYPAPDDNGDNGGGDNNGGENNGGTDNGGADNGANAGGESASEGSSSATGISPTALKKAFIAKTGDPLSPLVLTLFTLAAIALAACIFLFIASKRKKREEDEADVSVGNTPQANMRC